MAQPGVQPRHFSTERDLVERAHQEKISRRSALKSTVALALAPQVLAGCASASRVRPQDARERVGRRTLAPVQVQRDRIIRQVVGLRPFRRSGFALRAERLGEKVLVHNYGHGGGGISLSWGCAHLASQLVLESRHRRVAVLGCGVIGLTTARLLQDRGCDVTIYARDLPPHTTSNIAGAQWAPFSVADSDQRTSVFNHQFAEASRFAHRYFQNLVGARYGVWWRENYMLSSGARGAMGWEQQLLGDLLRMVTLGPDEHSFGNLGVQRFWSMHIEPAVFLTAVLGDFRIAGGKVVLAEFHEIPQVAALPEPLIVNCTGLGAGALFGDTEILPIKGQLTVLVPQPEVDYITIGPAGLYMMPRQDGIILGGTFQRNVSTLEPDPVEAERIFNGHQELFARMKSGG